MKYEKYLTQIFQAMMHDWIVVHSSAGECRNATGNIIEQMDTIDRELWTINYVATKNMENLKIAFGIPKEFIENSKAASWFAILKKYQEKK